MDTSKAYCIAYWKKYPDRIDKIIGFVSKLYEQYQHLSIDELRIIVCKDSYHACRFALNIDCDFHYETYQAVLGTKYEAEYIRDIMRINIDEEYVEGT